MLLYNLRPIVPNFSKGGKIIKVKLRLSQLFRDCDIAEFKLCEQKIPTIGAIIVTRKKDPFILYEHQMILALK